MANFTAKENTLGQTAMFTLVTGQKTVVMARVLFVGKMEMYMLAIG